MIKVSLVAPFLRLSSAQNVLSRGFWLWMNILGQVCQKNCLMSGAVIMYQLYLHCPRLLLNCNFIGNGTSIHFAAETSRWHICCFVKGQTFSWKIRSATFVLDEVTRPPYGEMEGRSLFCSFTFSIEIFTLTTERIVLSQFISPMTRRIRFYYVVGIGY